MAAKEIWDFLSATPVTPDYNAVLDVTPQKVLYEVGSKNQIVQLGDDDSEAIISYSDTSIFYMRLIWEVLTESDAGTIFDWWHDPAKANGMARTFKFQDHGVTDQHTYTVRFATSNISRSIKVAQIFGFSEIRLKIKGRAPT